jgi:hypothetical protein
MQTTDADFSRWLHRGALIAVAIVHPVFSQIWGDGAYAMYARTARYRFALESVDANGGRHSVAPSSLRGFVGGGGEMLLGAGDHEIWAPAVPSFRRHLADYARLVCDSTDAVLATASLDERSGEGAPPERTTRTVRCRR